MKNKSQDAPHELASRALAAFAGLSRNIESLLSASLEGSGITVQQCYCLEVLLEGPLSMGELARVLGVHQSTLSRTIVKLEHRRLLQRRREPSNQRKVSVHLTAMGRQLHRQLDEHCHKSVLQLIQSLPQQQVSGMVQGVEFLNSMLNPAHSDFREKLLSCESLNTAKE